jgi:hypothetical protein
MTEHDDAPTADQAERPLSDDELDAVVGGGAYNCTLCSASFNNSTDLAIHMEISHG